MNQERKAANAVGMKAALKTSLIGVIAAYVIMAIVHFGTGYTSALSWIASHDFAMHFIIGAASMFLFSVVFGPWSGRQIVLSKMNPTVIGIFSGFMAVWGATFVGSLVAYIGGAGAYAETWDGIQSFFVRPFNWVTLLGIIPICLMGYFYGRSVSRN